MSLELVSRDLNERRRGLIGWAVGLVGYAAVISAIFPTFAGSENFTQAMAEYPDAIKEMFGGEEAFDLTSGPGFVSAEVYAFVLPILLTVVAVGIGASLAGEQESGLLDIILANPISRRRVVAERALTIVVATCGLATIVGVTFAMANDWAGLDLEMSNLVAVTVSVVLLVVFHGLVALAVGATSGRRSLAIGAATGLFAAGYLADLLGGMVDRLAPLQVVAPHHHAIDANPLKNGWHPGGLGGLAAACVLMAVIAGILFERTDVD